ncbi:hypothetical protein HY065_02420 [Candidatus Berkelbacteria bacterium]|nr:hypothetical protein [Candidatus Berkelbacteria bacterium]
MDKQLAELRQLTNEGALNGRSVELCFEIMAHHPDVFEQCFAARVLTQIMTEDMPQKVREFLARYDDLPHSVQCVLRGNILHEAGY